MSNVNSDKAYGFIRKRILEGGYAPGAALMTEQLSKEIGVSRTPVRDALRQLEADGLVSIRPRLGASVARMNLKELRELCELRLALEAHAAHLAAVNRNEVELAEIRFALEAMRSLVERIAAGTEEEPWLGELTREDVRFHIAIISAAKNETMKKEILRLHLINRVLAGSDNRLANRDVASSKAEMDERRTRVLASHTEIYEAIARRDGPAARKAMEQHIQELIEHSFRRMGRGEARQAARELTADEMLYST